MRRSASMSDSRSSAVYLAARRRHDPVCAESAGDLGNTPFRDITQQCAHGAAVLLAQRKIWKQTALQNGQISLRDG